MAKKQFEANFPRDLGKTKTLFEWGSSSWVEQASPDAYPALDDIRRELSVAVSAFGSKILESCEASRLLSFTFPKSLDNFGFLEWLKENHPRLFKFYSNHWSISIQEVENEQQKFLNMSPWKAYPNKHSNWLYCILDSSGRVFRIGKKSGSSSNKGLVSRFFGSPTTTVKRNNYVDDCLNVADGAHTPRIAIRVMSSELRRRGASKVWYCELNSDPEPIEQVLISEKLKLINRNSKTTFSQDPVNS
ncbi:MAG: hypothetical protein ABL962_19310 [Fimbriimonadaceae bacterium]